MKKLFLVIRYQLLFTAIAVANIETTTVMQQLHGEIENPNTGSPITLTDICTEGLCHWLFTCMGKEGLGGREMNKLFPHRVINDLQTITIV